MRKALFFGLIQAALVAALVVVAGPAAPAVAQENTFDTLIDVRMGERVFRAQCGRCHGRDARGNDETGAPDLTTGQFFAGEQRRRHVRRDPATGSRTRR